MVLAVARSARLARSCVRTHVLAVVVPSAVVLLLFQLTLRVLPPPRAAAALPTLNSLLTIPCPAGRSIKAGLTACDIVSKWTWAATLLQVCVLLPLLLPHLGLLARSCCFPHTVSTQPSLLCLLPCCHTCLHSSSTLTHC